MKQPRTQTIRRTPKLKGRPKAVPLTEDQADISFYERHKHEKSYTFEEVKRQSGHALELKIS